MLDRGFRVNEPDLVWVSDITSLWTAEGWLYLAIFLDLFSRMMVGWSMGERINSELVVTAFEMGQKRRGGSASPLVHSDRGSQYASSSFRQELGAYGCSQSMSRKGNCWDNAVAESFFSALKLELAADERFQNRQQARDMVLEYIEIFYNRSRIHSAVESVTGRVRGKVQTSGVGSRDLTLPPSFGGISTYASEAIRQFCGSYFKFSNC